MRHAEKAAVAQPTVHSVPENGAARREGDPEGFEQESAEEKNKSQRDEHRPEGDTQEGKTEDARGEAIFASQTDVTKDGSLEKEQGEACRFSTYSPFSWVLSLDKVCTCVCVCVCVCVCRCVCVCTPWATMTHCRHMCPQMRPGGVWRVGICMFDDCIDRETDTHVDTHVAGAQGNDIMFFPCFNKHLTYLIITVRFCF